MSQVLVEVPVLKLESLVAALVQKILHHASALDKSHHWFVQLWVEPPSVPCETMTTKLLLHSQLESLLVQHEALWRASPATERKT